MIRYIWKSWWRQPERFVLLLAGIVIISLSLSSFVGLTESKQGKVQEILQNRWNLPYEIMVVPHESSNNPQLNQLINLNDLQGMIGGISFDQYEKIKKIDEVEIAAPLSVLGFMNIDITLLEQNLANVKQPGIYRISVDEFDPTKRDGKPVRAYKTYEVVGNFWRPPADYSKNVYEIYSFKPQRPLGTKVYQLLMGIDPQAEAKLVGLNEATMTLGSSRYFRRTDFARNNIIDAPQNPYSETYMPILMSSELGTDLTYSYKVERLSLAFSNKEEAHQTIETVKQNGGSHYLDTVQPEGDPLFSKEFNSKDVNRILLSVLSGIDPQTHVDFASTKGEQISLTDSYVKPGQVKLLPISSPYLDRWEHAYYATPVAVNVPDQFKLLSFFDYTHAFRNVRFDYPIKNSMNPQWIGFYDPQKLHSSTDPISESKLWIYGINSSRWVLDKDNQPINPPTIVNASGDPYHFTSAPSVSFTTLEAAKLYLGDKAISSIRIKLKNIHEVNQESLEKVNTIAKKIERETGLVAVVTFGAAPQPSLIHVPQNGGQSSIGWFEQFWVKIGGAVPLIKETTMGHTGIMTIVLVLALAYVLATNSITLLTRSREFGILLSLGWRQAYLVRMLLLEAFMLGSLVAISSWAAAGVILLSNDMLITPYRFFSIGLIGWILYLFGAIPPIWISRKIPLQQMMNQGEIRFTAQRYLAITSLFRMAVGQILNRLYRSILSILAMSVPTSLLVFFAFVSFRLQGILYTSWLGQYTAVEIGKTYYVIMSLCFFIALLITTEMVWQNVTERKPELLLLISFGWPQSAVRGLILREGFLLGTVAAVCGLFLGFSMISFTYRDIPWRDFGILSVAGAVPIMIGALSGIIPGQMAIHLNYVQGRRQVYSTSKKTEAKLRVGIAIVLVLCISVTAGNVYQVMQRNVSNVDVREPSSTEVEQKKMSKFTPHAVTDGSSAKYDLTFMLNKAGLFSAKAVVEVENRSQDEWDDIVFYLIPNVFTKKNKPEFLKDAGEVKIEQIEVNHHTANYQLAYDKLTVSLPQRLQPGEKTFVTITYQFSLPKNGLRFTQENNCYYLAQAYPMLATYDKGWNKKGYLFFSESYHTSHSEFKVSYQVPPGYLFVSSADNDPSAMRQIGDVTVHKSKEVFIGILKDMEMVSQRVGDVEIRVFGSKDNQKAIKLAMETSSKALQAFLNKIGPYPHKQLDIIIDGIAMEYPGIVTVGSGTITNSKESIQSFKETVVHEIAHQWFYGVVSNDPYHDGWLDEGIVSLATAMYFYDDEMMYESSFDNLRKQVALVKGKPSNLPLDNYKETKVIGVFYAQPALKLWELISLYGDIDEGWVFLHTYYEKYAYKQVSTEEFIRFVTTYFPVEKHYFSNWLQF
ncbi:FtsX-like permease family protein [Brevibacillus sp. SYSU BS000544]|uniref:FtsX-like permease family protein n=1 Tax=Brevibacillus sp. SYSU BS000544 TaxID=3416443 RepID=UPI003CE5C1EC